MIARLLIPLTAAIAITALLISLPPVESGMVVDAQPTSHRTISVFAVGVVEGAHEEVELRFQVADRVKVVHVREGERVKQGQLIAELICLSPNFT